MEMLTAMGKKVPQQHIFIKSKLLYVTLLLFPLLFKSCRFTFIKTMTFLTRQKQQERKMC